MDYDPEDLYQETDRPEIEKWIEACQEAKDVPKQNGGPAFTDWELEFLENVAGRFAERESAQHPLSGKQLLALRKMYDKT